MRVGIDSVEIERISKSIQSPAFLKHVFSVREIEMLSQKKMSAQSYAGNFAAKEAFSKALGTGIRGFSLNEISVLRDELGAPYFELSGNAESAAKGYAFTVSITHTKDTATAIVIAY